MFKSQPESSGKPYTSSERLYLNAEGKVVKEDDPSKLTLLVPEGGVLPSEQATKYGLTNEPKAQPQPVVQPEGEVSGEPEKKAMGAPSENKAITAPKYTK